MTWSDAVDHIKVMLSNSEIEMGVDECQPWTCSPVAEEAWLDIIKGQISFDKAIVSEEDHS